MESITNKVLLLALFVYKFYYLLNKKATLVLSYNRCIMIENSNFVRFSRNRFTKRLLHHVFIFINFMKLKLCSVLVLMAVSFIILFRLK